MLRNASQQSELLQSLKAYYDIPDISLYEQLRLLVSDSYNDWNTSSSRRNYDQILPRLYLGRLPRHGGFELPEDVRLIVSVNTLQEVSGKGMWSEVITPADFESKGIRHLLVHMPDFTADVSPTEVLNATAVMRDILSDEDGGAVYVHCKAGRSRSAMLCAVYLVIYGGSGVVDENNIEAELTDAINFIKRCRPQVDVDPEKIRRAREILGLFAKTNHESSSRSESVSGFCIQQDEYAYLASVDAKDAIRQLTAFKELARYATHIQKPLFGCRRTNHIRDFFRQIYDSNDGKWYDDLIKKEGHVGLLLAANKGDSVSGRADKAERERLMTNLIADVQHLVNEKRTLVFITNAAQASSSGEYHS